MKPILFSAPMVRAILDGQKTMTRRVIKFPDGMTGRLPECGATDYLFYPGGIKRPKYNIGDVLWVRETWMPEVEEGYSIGSYIYRATDKPEQDGDYPLKWKPSIFMPKEAARILLRITNVKAERVQDITVEDAFSEGIECDNKINNPDPQTHDGIKNWNLAYAQFLFKELWDSINKKRGYGWSANPWVWVYSFERINADVIVSQK